MTTLTRRPWPYGVEDIGTWQDVLDVIIGAAVVTNGAMIVFTMPVTYYLDDFTRFWIFIGFQWVLFSLQFAIRAAIPDVPQVAKIQTERAATYNLRLVTRTPPDDLRAVKEDPASSGINWSVLDSIKEKFV